MKTPLDNFELLQEQYNYTPENSTKPIYVINVSLVHNKLPIVFKRKWEWTWKLGEVNIEGVSRCILLLFKDVYNWSQHGIAQTFSDEITLGRKTIPNGKPGFMYSPEWDKEKEAWFVLDENNEKKIYE